MSYEHDLGGYELHKRAVSINCEALQLKREYYSPVYDTEEKTSGRIPDFRNLISWSPEINTGAEGRTTQEFYSSDLPGRYAIIVEGITANGVCGSAIKFIHVKEE